MYWARGLRAAARPGGAPLPGGDQVAEELALPLAAIKATVVHARSSRTRHILAFVKRAGRESQLAIACFRRHKKRTANHWLAKTRHVVAAINNHDARRNDDATYRKTRKKSSRLRTPTLRTEVRLVSSQRK